MKEKGKQIELSEHMKAVAKEIEACRPVFTALGEENRQHIVIALLENYGGMRVREIAKTVNLSRPAVSHHLKILKEAGIINMFKKGAMNFYHMDANVTQWALVLSLVTHVNEVVQAASQTDGCVQFTDNLD